MLLVKPNNVVKLNDFRIEHRKFFTIIISLAGSRYTTKGAA